MQPNHGRAISGLSLAVIIISALTLACCVIAWIFVTIAGSSLNQYGASAIDNAMSYGHHNGYHGYEYYNLDSDDVVILGNLALFASGIALLWEAATALVTLIAGIVGIRNARNQQKLGGVFGWSIAGAICALLGGRIATMVLCIIMAVFANKDKNAPVYATAYPSQSYAGQPNQYYANQPYTQQPYTGQQYNQQAYDPAAYQSQVAQPVYTQPVAQPTYQQPITQAPVEPTTQPVDQPQVYTEAVVTETVVTEETPTENSDSQNQQ